MYQRGSFLLTLLVSITIIFFSIVVIVFTRYPSTSLAWKDSISISDYETGDESQHVDSAPISSEAPQLKISEGTFGFWDVEPSENNGITTKLEIVEEPNPLYIETISVNQVTRLSAFREGEEVFGFASPLQIIQQFGTIDLAYVRAESLKFYHYNESSLGWDDVPTQIDRDGGIAKAIVEDTGIYSLRAKPSRVMPVITSVTPSVFSSGEKTSLVIVGTGFMPPVVVRIHGVTVESVYVSSQELTVLINAGLLPAGEGWFEVMNVDKQAVRYKTPIRVLP